MANRSNRDDGRHLIDIVEHAVVTHTKLPDRLLILPGWNQTGNTLSIASLPRGFVGELDLDTVQDTSSLPSPQVG
jgi:hypothetical protein